MQNIIQDFNLLIEKNNLYTKQYIWMCNFTLLSLL